MADDFSSVITVDQAITILDKKSAEIQESLAFNGMDFPNPTDYYPEGWGFGTFPGHSTSLISLPSDRFDGSNRPFFWTLQDVAIARGMARYIATTNEIGKGVVENLKNYTIEGGVDLQVTSRRNRQVDPALIMCAQDIIDDFFDDNEFKCNIDLELAERDVVDGEYLLAMYPGRGMERGKTIPRIIEPEQIVQPEVAPNDTYLMDRYGSLGVNITQETSTLWGVHTDLEDSNNIHGFFVKWNPSDSECDYIPAKMAVWNKANVPQNVKRGMSDFFPVYRNLVRQAKLLANTAEGATELAAIAYIIQYANASNDQVKTMRDAQANVSYNYRNAGGQTTTVNQYKLVPGSKLNVPKGQEYLAGPMGAERGQAFIEVLQALCRQCAVRWQMTEGMVSGNDQNANMACHDDVTECLTEEGWKSYKDLRLDLKIATRNPTTGKLEFQKPRAIHVYNHAGPMVHFSGSHNLDIMVTQNHRMWVAKKVHAVVGGKMTLTKELHPYGFVTAGDLANRKSQHYMHFSADSYVGGESPEVITIPLIDRPHALNESIVKDIRDSIATESQNSIARRLGISRCAVQKVLSGEIWKSGKLLKRNVTSFETKNFLAFLGYWISEGWTSKSKSQYPIGISQNEGAESECIENILETMGMNAFKRVIEVPEVEAEVGPHRRTRHFKWTFSNKSLYFWLREYCGTKSRNQKIPSFIKNFSADLLNILLDALIAGDGSDRNGPDGPRQYFTSSKQLADDVQEIAIKCGFVTSIVTPKGKSVVYTVTIKRADSRLRGIHPTNQAKIHEYVGPVWCCTVDNGLMITRRNGKVAVTGNSSVEAGSRFWKAMKTRQGRHKTKFRTMGFRILFNAWRGGLFSRWNLTWDQLKRLIDVKVSLPEIDVRNPLEQAQAGQIMKQNGVMSVKTWQLHQNLDPDIEASHGAQDQTVAGGKLADGPDGSQANVDKDSPQSDMPRQEQTQEESAPVGEFGSTSRLQWKRNVAGIKEVLDAVASGDRSPEIGVHMLCLMGISEVRAQKMVQSVKQQSEGQPLKTRETIARECANEFANELTEWNRLALENASYP